MSSCGGSYVENGVSLTETLEEPGVNLLKPWGCAKPGGTRRNPAEPGGNLAEPAKTRRNPAETWRNLTETWRNPAEKK